MLKDVIPAKAGIQNHIEINMIGLPGQAGQ